MAYETGTANDHTDLYNKLIAFLTTNQDLVDAEQNWEVVWSGNDFDGEVVLKGPGLSKQDAVFVGIGRHWNPTADEYRLHIRGMTGIISSADTLNMHVNVSPFNVRMFLDGAPMTYWFVANGRRLVVVVKISTVFEALYAGLIHPYATPTVYPYPLFIGGSSGEDWGRTDAAPKSWRSTSDFHRHFIDPVFSSSKDVSANAYFLDPLGQWLEGGNLNSNTVTYIYPEGKFYVGPRFFYRDLGAYATDQGYSVNYRDANARITPAFGGAYVLVPMTITASHPADQTYGTLDGVYDISGYANSSENIIQLDLGDDRIVDHLVVQDAFRTGIGQYWALALE